MRRTLWNPGRRLLWTAMGLRCELRSGLAVWVREPSDWRIYNEILVNGEYDVAITRALDQSTERDFRVIDLGANVGYFVLRCADLFLQRTQGKRLSILAIEGSPETSQELKKRMKDAGLDGDCVRIVNGLVGKRSGAGHISNFVSHYGNSVREAGSYTTQRVPYMDLAAALDPEVKIDLLKCDIEGSEFDFLDNYPDLLQRVRLAVFEFHKNGRDLDHYRSLLLSYGLRHSVTLREAPMFSIELFSRA